MCAKSVRKKKDCIKSHQKKNTQTHLNRKKIIRGCGLSKMRQQAATPTNVHPLSKRQRGIYSEIVDPNNAGELQVS
jgi:hypothetical protein